MHTKILIVLVILLVSYNVSTAQAGYLGIVPMHSTCEDVKRILNVSTCNPPDNTFDLGKDKLRIKFTKMPCEKNWAQKWNVPIGTVIIIERYPKETLKLSDLRVDLSKYTKIETDFTLQGIYVNEDEGIEIESVENKVRKITYTPTKKDEYLLCTYETDSGKDKNHVKLPRHWFERYYDIPVEDEKLLLKYVANAFKECSPNGVIYIVAQPDSEIDERRARERAENAKGILVKEYSVDEKKIVTVVTEKKESLIAKDRYDDFQIKVYIDCAESKKPRGK